MENQDHRAPISSGHGVYLCSKCGWPFPNPHPSAKHRRAHKKVCGTIDGYKVTQPELTHLAISEEEEQPLSDEGRTPSPKIEGKSLMEVAGSCQSTTRSEDEHFSDAMAEFSDSGLSPGMDEGSEVARKLVRDVEKFEEEGEGLLKVDATIIVDDPSRTLQIGDLQQVESEMKSPDASTLLGSTSEESTIGLNETSGQQLESRESKTLAVLTVEDEKETTENAPLSDDRQDICAKDVEHANIVDAPVDHVPEGDKASSSLSLDVYRNLEVGEKSDDFLQDSTTTMRDMSTDDKKQYESVGDKDVHMLSVDEGISSLNYSQDHKDHGSLKSRIALDIDTSNELLSSTQDDDKSTLEDNDQFIMDACKPDQHLLGPPTILDASGDDIRKDDGKVLAEGKNDMDGSEVINDEQLESFGLVSATVTPESPALTLEPTISLSKEDESSENNSREEVTQSIPTILDAKVDDIKNPIEENSQSYGLKVINDEIFGSCGSGSATSTLESPILNFEPTNSLPMEDESLQCKPLDGSDDNSTAPRVCKEDKQAIISRGSEIIYDRGIDETKMSFTAENESSDDFLQDYTTMHDVGTEDKNQHEFVGDKDVHMLYVDEGISSLNNSQDHGSLKSTIALDMDTHIELSSTQGDNKSTLEDNDQFIMDACKPDQLLLRPPTILDASGDDIKKDGGEVLAEGKNDMDGSDVIKDEQSESYGLVSATATPESPTLTMEPTISLSMEDESSESHLREEVRQSIPTILDAKADDIENPIEESSHSYGSTVIKDENFGSCGSGPATSTLESPILNFEPTSSLPMEDESSQCKPLDSSDDNSTVPRVCEEDKQAVISGGSEIIYDCGIDKTKMSITAENESSEDYLPDQCSADTQIAGSEHREKVDANDTMGNTEPMHDSSAVVVESTSADVIDERKDGSVIEASSVSSNHDMNLGNNDVVVDSTRAFEVCSLPPVKGEDDDDKTGKQQDGGATVVDKSVASSSRTDSLEANWGSVSESTLHVDGGAQEKPSLQETTTQAERNPHTFDDIADQNVHKDPSDEAATMKAAVGNEESQQGRTKNEEERIAKVTNWKQQHTPLKNLLGEAKSPKNDEAATASSKVTTTVNSILRSEDGQKEVDKEWDSPARYRPSVDVKKERKKGKTYWVPFACCSSSSVH